MARKLNDDQVKLIKHMHKNLGTSARELGRMFNVSAMQISRIINKKQQKDV